MPYKTPDKGREYRRKWRAANRDKIREYNRKWQAANSEKYRESQRNWRDANPDKIREHTLKRALKKYGITLEDYNTMSAQQGGLCAICESPPDQRVLVIDHDHVTGKVRGLLCDRCNTGIGKLRDSPDLMAKAIRYLRQ